MRPLPAASPPTVPKAGCAATGQGRFSGDPLNTFGGAGAVEIPEMQKLLHFICERGFEHHVAANLSRVASSVHEAATRYFGWEMYYHGCGNGAC